MSSIVSSKDQRQVSYKPPNPLFKSLLDEKSFPADAMIRCDL